MGILVVNSTKGSIGIDTYKTKTKISKQIKKIYKKKKRYAKTRKTKEIYKVKSHLVSILVKTHFPLQRRQKLDRRV